MVHGTQITIVFLELLNQVITFGGFMNVYGIDTSILNGVYQPSKNEVAPHCRDSTNCKSQFKWDWPNDQNNAEHQQQLYLKFRKWCITTGTTKYLPVIKHGNGQFQCLVVKIIYKWFECSTCSIYQASKLGVTVCKHIMSPCQG